MWKKWILVFAFAHCVLWSMLGCNDLTGRNKNDELPAGVPDPKTLDNPAGALAQYYFAICSFQSCTGGNAVGALRLSTEISGLFSDELKSNRLGRTALAGDLEVEYSELRLDSRKLVAQDYSLNIGPGLYVSLHMGRRNTRLAAAALRKYGAQMNPALRGHMFALEAYADLLLADLYCSGIPLSTVDYEGDYTYQSGSTTQEVYAHAVTLFDSALAVSTDSARILNLARVGKARTLLNLGRFAEAAQVANSVPVGFVYQYNANWMSGTLGGFTRANITISNSEGGNGLPYLSSRDPRTAGVNYGINTITRDTLWFPAKYGTQTSISAVTLASAVEARLIEAEAALHQENLTVWLDMMNALRTDGTFTLRPNTAVPTQIDTLWNAGTGGVAGLGPLRDPGVTLPEPAKTDSRINLIFAERAAWMFLTGHRQGDLRRLVRATSNGGYGRDADLVYPTGPYAAGPLLSEYGNDIDLVIPEEEHRNPKFTGCQERGA